MMSSIVVVAIAPMAFMIVCILRKLVVLIDSLFHLAPEAIVLVLCQIVSMVQLTGMLIVIHKQP